MVYNYNNISKVLDILGVEPNETFSIVSPGYGNTVIVKRAYISETLHLFDGDDGKMKDVYIPNLLRGVLQVSK